MTGPRESILQQTANLLLDARRTGVTLAELPADLVPDGPEEICFVQDLVAAAFGPVGGYKIGAPSLEATPTFAPMPAAWIARAGSTVATVEAEIAFLVGKDLPPRPMSQGQAPYSREEVLGAMASCHPAIEVLESAFTEPVLSTPGCQSDLQTHGGLIYGPAFDDWRTADFSAEHVVLSIDGVLRAERTGSNTSGDLLRLPVYLANEGAARTGGLKAGQWITTGSWTGLTRAIASCTVDACFSTAGRVQMFFV
jgi:2-keto-4-pentenoate hydratase